MACKVGVIGLGLMGERMLRTLAEDRRFEIGPLFDTDAARAERAAATFAGRAVESVEETWADSVDLVYIATPPATHVRFGRAATNAGRAVLCEKPLAVDLAEAERWVDEVEKSGSIATVHFPFSTLPGLTTVEERLASREWGEPESVEIRLRFSQWPRTWHHAGAWLSGRAEGGFTREVFSHFAYLTHRLIGPLELRSAEVEYPGPGATEHRVEASFRVGAIPVRLIGSIEPAAEDYCAWTLTCSGATVRLEDWRTWSRAEGDEFVEVDASFLERGVSFCDALRAAVDGGSHPLPDLRVGLDVQRVVEGVLATG